MSLNAYHHHLACVCNIGEHKSSPKFSGSQHEKRNLVSHSIHSGHANFPTKFNCSWCSKQSETFPRIFKIGGVIGNHYNFVTIHTTRYTGLLIKMSLDASRWYAQTQYERCPSEVEREAGMTDTTKEHSRLF